MPTIQGADTFAHGTFTTPVMYSAINGTPTRDTTVVRGSDPASLLISTPSAAEDVENTISGSPTLGWQACAWRLNAADEPGLAHTIMGIRTAGGDTGDIRFNDATNQLQSRVNLSDLQSVAYTFDTWVWIEQIFDVSSATLVQYVRVNGVDLTPSSLADAASTISDCYLGTTSVLGTITMRYSCHLWGTASSPTDWLGEQECRALKPNVVGSHSIDVGSGSSQYFKTEAGVIVLPDTTSYQKIDEQPLDSSADYIAVQNLNPTADPDADNATDGWTSTPLYSKVNDDSDSTFVTDVSDNIAAI